VTGDEASEDVLTGHKMWLKYAELLHISGCLHNNSIANKHATFISQSACSFYFIVVDFVFYSV